MASTPSSMDVVLGITALIILGGGVLMLVSSMFDIGGRM